MQGSLYCRILVVKGTKHEKNNIAVSDVDNYSPQLHRM